MTARVGAALFVWFLALGGAQADEPKPAPLKPAVEEGLSINEFVRLNSTCGTFTDGCQICRKTETTVQCSTPGLTCQPGPWKCDEAAAPAP